jgi:hypothetical protein
MCIERYKGKRISTIEAAEIYPDGYVGLKDAEYNDDGYLIGTVVVWGSRDYVYDVLSKLDIDHATVSIGDNIIDKEMFGSINIIRQE